MATCLIQVQQILHLLLTIVFKFLVNVQLQGRGGSLSHLEWPGLAPGSSTRRPIESLYSCRGFRRGHATGGWGYVWPDLAWPSGWGMRKFPDHKLHSMLILPLLTLSGWSSRVEEE